MKPGAVVLGWAALDAVLTAVMFAHGERLRPPRLDHPARKGARMKPPPVPVRARRGDHEAREVAEKT